MKKYTPVLLLALLVLPSVALASWWNPFSWFKKVQKEIISCPLKEKFFNENCDCPAPWNIRIGDINNGYSCVGMPKDNIDFSKEVKNVDVKTGEKIDKKETSLLGNNILSDSFTIQLSADNSSSGAGRKYNGELTFENNKLVSGFQNYKVSPGRCGEGVANCDRYTECIIKNQKWVDAKNNGECMIDPFVALTKDGIQKQINAKEIIYSENINSCHYSTCFKIKKINVTEKSCIKNEDCQKGFKCIYPYGIPPQPDQIINNVCVPENEPPRP